MGRKNKQTRLPDGTMFYYLNKLETLFMYKEIFDNGAYSNDLVSYGDGDTVVDVGANIALYLHFVVKQCKGPKLYAFEPMPRLFKALELNFPKSNGEAVHLFECGVSREPGEATFTYLPHCTARSTMYPEHSPANNSAQGRQREEEFMLLTFKELPSAPLRVFISMLPMFLRRPLAAAVVRYHAKTKEVTCELKTVSQIIEENDLEKIDILKVDAENSEVEILHGIKEEHWARIRQLVIEIHPGPEDPLKQVLEMMEKHGFKTEVAQDNTLHPSPTVFASRD